MSAEGFFSQATEQSQVKTAIVDKYFEAWAGVMISQAKKYPWKSSGRIAYVDLFAGPGYYKNGTPSTPILILRKAIEDEDLRERLVTVFNDKDSYVCDALESAIQQLPGIQQLKHPPQVRVSEIGDEIVEILSQRTLVPTLFFMDPFGYKGLSHALFNSALKDWGSECVIFFNLNRIRMTLHNELFREHMEALFGGERFDTLCQRLTHLTIQARELAIVEAMCAALEDAGAEYVLPFRFKDERGTRTSHYLIHASKNELGYEIMKGIMAGESSQTDQGVPSFEYSPADRRFPRLFELTRPLDDLEDMLLDEFAESTLTMLEVYRAHHVNRPYIKRNYKHVLYRMETNRKLSCNPPHTDRRKNTFADDVEVTFPDRRQG